MRNPLSSILQLADNVLMSLPPIAEDGQVGVLTADARHSLVDSAQTIVCFCSSAPYSVFVLLFHSLSLS